MQVLTRDEPQCMVDDCVLAWYGQWPFCRGHWSQLPYARKDQVIRSTEENGRPMRPAWDDAVDLGVV